MIEDIPNTDTTDKGTQYSLKLRTKAAKISGILKKLFVTLLIVCPHSMTTERVISHYNQIKTNHKISLLEETINYRQYVSLNGVRTAHYDLRPVVIEFFLKKERRYREPELSTYKHRDFISKFLRKKTILTINEIYVFLNIIYKYKVCINFIIYCFFLINKC